MEGKSSPLKTALQRIRIPKLRKASAPSSPSGASGASQCVDPETTKINDGADSSSSSEVEAEELSGTPKSESGNKRGAAIMGDQPANGKDLLDPKVTGIVLACSMFILWKPSLSLLLALLVVSIVLGFVVVTLCIYIRQQTPSVKPSAPSSIKTDDDPTLDVTATAGLQQLFSPGWIRMRSIIAQRDFRGVVTEVDLGDQAPEVTFVQSEKPPCDDVVCYNIGLNLSADSANTPGIPYVQIEVKVPGYSVPWIFRMKLLALDITVQLYFWSLPPDGRGSGRPYSLIEAALSPEPFKPHTVKVALEGISESSLFEQFLSRCEPIASAVICSHVLPRFSGFQNRVILEEGKIEKDAEQRKKRRDKTWQQHARRAGWQPRAEAAVESVGTSEIRKISSFRFQHRVFQTHWWTKAVGQMFQEAGGFAYEAVANTAASAAAQAAGAARLFKNSFGLDIWSFRISWK